MNTLIITSYYGKIKYPNHNINQDVLFTEEDIKNATESIELFSEEDIANASNVTVVQGVDLHGNPDATAWAREFCKFNTAADFETMRGWFANAMMAMSDYIRSHNDLTPSESEQLEFGFGE